MRRKKQTKKRMLLLSLLLVVAVGYAIITTTLNINGFTAFKGVKWKIYWDNISVKNGSVDGSANITGDKKTSIVVNASFEALGDYYEFDVDMVNDGDFNAAIDTITTEFYEVEDEEETTITKPSFINLSYTYENGKQLRRGDVLNKDNRRRCKIRVSIVDEVEDEDDLPDAMNLKTVITINYKKTDKKSVTLKKGSEVANIMYNLAYKANIDDIGDLYDSSYGDDWRYQNIHYKISDYIEHFKMATDEQYDEIKDSLTSDNLISLTTEEPSSEMIQIATSAAVTADNEDADPVYMWYDKDSKTIYYYSEIDTIELNQDSSYMFFGLDRVEDIELTKFSTESVENMSYMFRLHDNYYLNRLNVLNFNTSNVTNMSHMFTGFESLSTLNVSNFDTSNVTDMSYMFEDCSDLENLNLSSFNTSNVTNMRGMFYECDDLSRLDLSSFDTKNVTNMASMFYYCSDLTNITFSSKFDTSKVTNMAGMFYNCYNLESLDLSSFNTSKVEDMNSMFEDLNLTVLDLSSFDTKNVEDMTGMFGWCRNLETIYAGDNWSTDKVTSHGNMFYSDTKIMGGYGTTYDSTKTDKTYAKIDTEETKGYLTRKGKTIVRFNANGGTVNPTIKEITPGNTIGTLPNPTHGTNEFLGWYDAIKEGNEITSEYTPTKYIELFARWKYIIQFDAGEGATVSESSREVISGNAIGTLPTATKTGYSLKGWYTQTSDGEQITRDTIPTNSVTYHAIWAPDITITYDANSGKFSNNETTNVSEYKYDGTEVVKYSHTPNVNDQGVANGTYASNLSRTDTVTIEGADELNIEIWFSTESTSFDWVAIYPANVTPTASNYAQATISNGKLGNGKSTTKPTESTYHKTYTVSGDTVKFYFKSDGSQNFYGYYAIITASNHSYKTNNYEVPTNGGNDFLGWNTNRSGTGTTYADETAVIDDLENLAPSTTLYAMWDFTSVAEVNGEYFDTLTEAISSITTTNETTINLLQNTSGLFTIPANRNIILNLNGKVISNTDTNVIKNNGKLTLNDGNISCSAGSGAIDVESTGTLIINDVTVAATGSRQALYNNGGTVTIKGDSRLTSQASARATVHNLNNGTMTILSGTIISENLYAVYNESGTLNIGKKDGNISTTNPLIQGKTYGVVANSQYNFYDGVIKGRTYHVGTATTGTTPTVAIDTNETKINEIDPVGNKKLENETISGVTYKTIYLEGAPKYTITLNPKGGELETTEVEVTQGFEIGNLPTPTKENSRFSGWYTTEETGGEKVESDYVPTGNITLYARWTVKTTNIVTLEANGGLVSPTSLEVPIGDPITSIPDPARAGYTFLGWYTGLTDGTLVTAPFTPQDDIKIYARWNTFPTVFSQTGACTFNGSSGNITGVDCSDYTNGKYIDTEIPLYSSENYKKDFEIGFTIENYVPSQNVKQATFVNAKSEDSSKNWPGLAYRRNEATDNLEITQTINGTREFQVSSYTNVQKVKIVRQNNIVKYSYNDGALQLLQDMSDFNQQFNISTWFGAAPTDAIGTGAQRYLVGTLSNMYIKLGDYQESAITQYTIEFNPNYGTVKPTYKQVDMKNQIGQLPTPTREHFTFDGWYTGLTDGTLVTTSTVPTGSVTYYAHWTEDPYHTITFNNNDETGTTTTRKVYDGETIGELPTPTRTNYQFVGWFTGMTDGTQIQSTDVLTSNPTVYAHWIESQTDPCNYEPANICQAERAQIEANPNAYRNPNQDPSNLDIGLDENCNVINLDMWVGRDERCYDYDEEDWPELDYCSLSKEYYIANDSEEIDEDSEDISLLPNDEITLGIGRGNYTPATSSAQVINGEMITPIPAYILLDGESEFYPVTETRWIFGDENGRGRNSGNPITKMPHLPSTIHTIGSGTFIDTNISEIIIPKNVRNIESAFYRIFETSISVSFEEGSKMEVLSEGAFGDYDVDLTGNLEIPMCVKVIENNAFSNSNLSSLTFESGSKLREIKLEAFYNSGLTGNLVLPETVEYIGENAFSGNNLTSITFPSSATYFDSSSSYPSFDSGVTISHIY